MKDYTALDAILGEYVRSSKHGMQFSLYRLATYHGIEVHITWANGAKLSFTISDLDLLKNLMEVLDPYLEKISNYEELLSSPLMGALK